ncbi:hypothetical protein ACGRHY_29150 [Streptomyces sp. HK10]|uniref:hypothetical protein n=1 Tax=Streptomyces sp. HK10 TaxID=3373255 RepID=UPI0037479F32
MSDTTSATCPEPLRFWDGDRLAAVHGRRVWRRWSGQRITYLFTDAQARGRLWHPDESDAVRFIPRVPVPGRPLPGSAVTADAVAGLVLASARSAVPRLLPPRRSVHRFAPRAQSGAAVAGGDSGCAVDLLAADAPCCRSSAAGSRLPPSTTVRQNACMRGGNPHRGDDVRMDSQLWKHSASLACGESPKRQLYVS